MTNTTVADPDAPTRSLTTSEVPTMPSIQNIHEDGSLVVVEPLAPDSPRSGDSPPGPAPLARCADGNGTMTGLFFSDNVVDIARATAMCGLCPLQEACLAGALEREEPWGVWGGKLLSGGRVVTNKRPCGRPPKNPRPEIVYDELGPVGVVA